MSGPGRGDAAGTRKSGLLFGGGAHFLGLGGGHTLLMLLAGPVTAIPLLFFGAAAQRLPLVTLGLLQYLNPGLQMAWGVFIGHEAMPVVRWIGFALIWIALVVLSADAVRARPQQPIEHSVDVAQPRSSSR